MVLVISWLAHLYCVGVVEVLPVLSLDICCHNVVMVQFTYDVCITFNTYYRLGSNKLKVQFNIVLRVNKEIVK